VDAAKIQLELIESQENVAVKELFYAVAFKNVLNFKSNGNQKN